MEKVKKEKAGRWARLRCLQDGVDVGDNLIDEATLDGILWEHKVFHASKGIVIGFRHITILKDMFFNNFLLKAFIKLHLVLYFIDGTACK